LTPGFSAPAYPDLDVLYSVFPKTSFSAAGE
jgi:hypothetical protein